MRAGHRQVLSRAIDQDVAELTRPRLYVALPWLEDAARDARERQSLPQLPALAWLPSRGTLVPMRQATGGTGCSRRAVMPTPQHMLARCASRPLRRSVWHSSIRRLWAAWACAQPVHLAAAMDHLRLAPLQQLN